MFSILFVASVAFGLSFLLTPLCRNLFLRWGWVDSPDNQRKTHPVPIPRAGGIPILLGGAGALALLTLTPLHGGGIFAQTLPLIWKLLPALGVVFLTGLCDDLIGLRPWQKLAGQLAAAGLVCYAQIQIVSIGGLRISATWWHVPVTILWLVGCTNAFNLIDGVDGLAAGIGLFATLATLVAALSGGSFDLALATAPLAGALIGFLRYNFNPASIFLGDSGSLSIGFLLGCYGIMWSQKSATMLGMTAPLMALAIPLLDTGLSIVRRLLRGQPVFSADRGHIHHRLLDQGLTPRRVALVLYGMCGIGAVLSLLQNAMGHQFGGLILILFCAGAWMGIEHLGYVEFDLARRLALPNTFRRVLNAQLRLRALEDALSSARTADECWTAIRSASADLGFNEVSMRIDRQVYQAQLGPADPRECWSLDVPLSDYEFVRLGHSMTSEFQPMTPGFFAALLRRVLGPRLPDLRRASRAAAPEPDVPLDKLLAG